EIVAAVRTLCCSEKEDVAIEALSPLVRFSPEKACSVAIRALAETPLSSVRMWAVAVACSKKGYETDVPLMLGTISLADMRPDYPIAQKDEIGHSSILARAADLYESGASVKDLVGMLAVEKDRIPAALLIRLMYREESAKYLDEGLLAFDEHSQQQVTL